MELAVPEHQRAPLDLDFTSDILVDHNAIFDLSDSEDSDAAAECNL